MITTVPRFARLRGIRTVPAHLLGATAAASAAAVAFGAIDGWALWVVALAALLPWVPILALEIAWTYHHYGWLALFYVLVITQVGHVVEHVCQMFQLHVLHLHGPDAQGVFGQLNTEWVHFAWNSWVLVALAVLAVRFRGNPWLLGAIVLAGWHQFEHVYIMSVYLQTGTPGTPGILARGGVFGDLLGVRRPELHFFYNVVETIPILVAFVFQLRRTYDTWLARAFPAVPEEQLREVTPRLSSVRVPAGTTISADAEAADREYIIVKGEIEISRGGSPTPRVTTVGPGCRLPRPSGSPTGATVRARTPVELLAVDQRTARVLASGGGSSGDVESRDTVPEALVTLRARLAQ